MLWLKIVACAAMGCMIFGGVELAAAMNDFSHLSDELQIAQPSLHSNKLVRFHPLRDSNQLINVIVDQMQGAGLLVMQATIERAQSDKTQIAFEIQGDFYQLIHFFQTTLNQQIVLQMDALQMDARSEKNLILLKATVLNGYFDQAKSSLRQAIQADPFHGNYFINLLFDRAPKTSVPSLKDIHYVGFFQLGDEKTAVFLLPHGLLYDAKRQESVGQEGARVMQIDQASVTLELHQQVIRKLRV